MLLVPNYLYCKPWYEAALRGTKPVYLVPMKRYTYETEFAGTGAKKVDPFVSFWFIGGLSSEHREELLSWWASEAGAASECHLAGSLEDLPKKILKMERFARKKVQKRK
jgi:hypothetical protein